MNRTAAGKELKPSRAWLCHLRITNTQISFCTCILLSGIVVRSRTNECIHVHTFQPKPESVPESKVYKVSNLVLVYTVYYMLIVCHSNWHQGY